MTRITATLPSDVKGIRYVKNHHFLELTDDEGNEALLTAAGVLVGDCETCKSKVAAFYNNGEMACTHCLSKKVKWRWSKPQIAFVSEQENQFNGYKQALQEAADKTKEES